MKLLNFYTDDGIHVGIKKDEGIIDENRESAIGSRRVRRLSSRLVRSAV